MPQTIMPPEGVAYPVLPVGPKQAWSEVPLQQVAMPAHTPSMDLTDRQHSQPPAQTQPRQPVEQAPARQAMTEARSGLTVTCEPITSECQACAECCACVGVSLLAISVGVWACAARTPPEASRKVRRSASARAASRLASTARSRAAAVAISWRARAAPASAPRYDITVQRADAIGRVWQLSTVQVDPNLPERFELGTLPYEMLAGVTAAVDVLADLVPGEGDRRTRVLRSMAALEEYEDDLHARMREGLESIPGITLYSNAKHRTPTETFTIEGHGPGDISAFLAERGVNAPASNFYALEVSRWLGLGDAGGVRVQRQVVSQQMHIAGQPFQFFRGFIPL